jgi:hypothetical protein
MAKFGNFSMEVHHTVILSVKNDLISHFGLPDPGGICFAYFTIVFKISNYGFQ